MCNKTIISVSEWVKGFLQNELVSVEESEAALLLYLSFFFLFCVGCAADQVTEKEVFNPES